MLKSRCLIAVLCVLLAVSRASSQPDAAEVDKLFSPWARQDSPGCALAVIHNGKTVHKRGYGMADLEQGVPIKPTTIFNIASVSKQFTVFLIMLLAHAGLLSLDDAVRTHVPDVPDFGKKITIRHLISHTSGLREDWNLLTLSGWRGEDVITREDVFSLIRRQKSLNFDPGDDYTYCNTGYHLLAQIAQKVTGKEQRVLAHEKIFEPLGMTQTVFQDHHRMLIKGKAVSYAPKAGAFERMLFGAGRPGPGNLHTTVEDLAKWDENFYRPQVGTSKLIAEMLRKAKLNDGKEIDYAGGLRHGEYRGLPIVEHSGVIAGYRSVLLRFPEQRFSVVILANVSTFKPAVMARKVTDLYLNKVIRADLKDGATTPEQIAACAGDYRFASGLLYTFVSQDDRLFVKTDAGRLRLVAIDKTNFLEPESNTRFEFIAKGKEMTVRLQGIGRDQIGNKVMRPKLTNEDLAAFIGTYRSEELDTIYTIENRNGRLVVKHRKGSFGLEPLAADEFSGGPDALFSTARFLRSGDRVTGFTVSTPRVRHLHFGKVTIQPAT